MTFALGCCNEISALLAFSDHQTFGKIDVRARGKYEIETSVCKLSRSLFMFSALLTFSAAG